MKKIFKLFFFLIFLAGGFFLLTEDVNAQCITMSGPTFVSGTSTLPSVGDTITVSVRFFNGCGGPMPASGGFSAYVQVRFSVDSGNTSFYTSPSWIQVSPAVSSGNWSPTYQFTTTIKAGNTCTTSASTMALGELIVIDPIFGASTVVSSNNPVTGIGGVGAVLKGVVYNSNGTRAGGATVSISPVNSSVGTTTADANGNYTFSRINCTQSHTITATLGSASNSISIAASSAGGNVCNGQERFNDITLPPACWTPSWQGGSINNTVTGTNVTVSPGGSFYETCNYNAVVTCINVSNISNCSFAGFTGTSARWDCTAPSTPGTYPISCSVPSGVSCNVNGTNTTTCSGASNTIGNVIVPAPTNTPTPTPTPLPKMNEVRVIIDNDSDGRLDAGESFGTPNVNFSSTKATIDQNSTRGLFPATGSIGTNGIGGPWEATYSNIQYLVTPASGWQLTKYSSNKNLSGSPTCNANTTCDYSSGWTRTYSPAAGETVTYFLGIKPIPTATPTTAPTTPPTIAPTPVPCAVTTSPASLPLTVGGTGTVTASVTSGLGGASITRMRFGSYNTSIATVNPASDTTSVYSTAVTAVAAGSTAVWGTADLSDGRTCQSTSTTDTELPVSGPTSTPTPTPTTGPTPVPCAVTTSPSSCSLIVGGTGTVTASVTSGLGGASITRMRFGSYDTPVATVNPTSDTTSPYSTTVTAVANGLAGIWGTADLSDGRTCQSTSITDTDCTVTTGATPTPTSGPTPTPLPGTNLTVTSVTTNKSSYIPLEVMQITSTVRNSGTTNITTPFFTTYNTNGPASAPVCLSGWSGYDIFSLNSGVSDIRTTPRSAPATLGTYQAGVYADNNPCQITESNETDNYLRSAPYTVIAANYNLYVNSLVTKRGTDCASGVTTSSFAHGDSIVVCFTEGNNGTTATQNNFYTASYRNQSTKPAASGTGTAGQIQGPYEGGYVINNTSVGFFSADSSVCTSCNAAVNIDSTFTNNSETSELDNFASVPYTVSLPTYTISGNVFIDTNNNGVQDCNGLCDDGLGDELNYSLHTSVGRDGTGSPLTTTTDGTGSYSFSNLAGSSNYIITLTVPSGHIISNGGVNTRSVDVTTADVPNQNFGILLVPTHNVGGDIFVDDGTGCTPASTCAGDGVKDGTEGTADGPTTVEVVSGVDCSGAVIASSTTSTGTFSIGSIPEGDYLVCMTDPPSGYEITSPTTGPPPFIPVTVGATDVTGVDFGVLPFGRWIQSSGTDIRDDSGGSDTSTFIPPSAAEGGNNTGPTWSGSGPGTNNGNTGGSNGGGSGIGNSTCNASGGTSGSNYASTNGGAGGAGSPGIIFSGNNAADFGAGFASSTNWKVGSANPDYQDIYTPKNYTTSYAYVSGRVQQLGITRTTITSATCGVGGLTDCNLNSMNAGVYDVGNLTISNFNGGAGGIFSSAKKIIILVNGNLLIKSNIIVPIGSTLTFIVSGDITIDRSIGTTWDSATSQIEGFYSADKNFYIDGDPIVCSLTADRLNMEGSIIVNAGGTGGRFVNNRTLCTKNAFCPVFTISERPDFVLNSPESIKQVRTIYQEVAP